MVPRSSRRSHIGQITLTAQRRAGTPERGAERDAERAEHYGREVGASALPTTEGGLEVTLTGGVEPEGGEPRIGCGGSERVEGVRVRGGCEHAGGVLGGTGGGAWCTEAGDGGGALLVGALSKEDGEDQGWVERATAVGEGAGCLGSEGKGGVGGGEHTPGV